MPVIKSVIRLNDLDTNFVDEMIETGSEVFGEDVPKTILACMQCGRCSGSCPSGRRTAFRTRQIYREVVLGFREKVLSSDELWYCTTCYTCQERCPRGVKTTEIIRILRNIAAKEGYMSKSHKMAAGQVFKTGHAVAINEEIQNVREELGLSRLPPTTHSYPEALAKLQDILRRTHFDELVGFDWGTMELNEV